jgi:hypothetical protein
MVETILAVVAAVVLLPQVARQVKVVMEKAAELVRETASMVETILAVVAAVVDVMERLAHQMVWVEAVVAAL